MSTNSFNSFNISVLHGVLHNPPSLRVLPSGQSVTSLDVKVHGLDGRSEVLRVSWFDAPTRALELEEGAPILICGRVRRFWFAGGQSITDVLADLVVIRPTPARVRKTYESVISKLEAERDAA